MRVLLYPYLPLCERQVVGDWELIPVEQLTDGDSPNLAGAQAIRGLADLYDIPGSIGRPGAVARPREGRVGDNFEREAMRTLSRAVLVALLAGNPSPLLPEEERSGNEGHMMATSDNAIGYGHPIGEDGYIAVEYGLMATTLVGGLNVHRTEQRIAAPVELHVPLLGRSLDGYYANAVYLVLATGTLQARRVGRAIDWLDLAWRNTVSLNLDLRIVALRTAFEVLFDATATPALRGALSHLVDPPRVERRRRVWRTLSGEERVASLSDLEWWFTRFAHLRNAIAHGDELKEADYAFENGQNHLWLADARLREALAEVVARAGYPDVRLEPGLRTIRNALRNSGLDPDTGGQATPG